MGLFEEQILYWNKEYRFYSSDLYNGEELTDGPIALLERIDSYLTSNDIADEINIAGLYINMLIRPRTSFLHLSELNKKTDSLDYENIISAKQLIDIVSPLYRKFDIEHYLEKYLNSDKSIDLRKILDEVESEMIDNMDLDDIEKVLKQISNFFSTDGSLIVGAKTDFSNSNSLDYRAAVIFLDEKGFESVAAKIESKNKDNNEAKITIDYTIDSIVNSLQELEELGYNKYEYA